MKQPSSMKVGEYDIRNTSEEWTDIINGLDSPAMIFTVAESLAASDVVKEDDENEDGSVSFQMTRYELVKYALEKYLEMAGGVEGLFKKISEVAANEAKKHPNERVDLLELKLDAVDLIIKRNKLEEIEYVHIFLNAYRDFFNSFELLKVKLKDVYEAKVALENTQEVKVLSKKIIES